MSKSIRKAVLILNHLTKEPSNLTELAQVVETPPSTMHRILGELEDLQLIRKVGKRYHVGVRLIGLGEAARRQLDITSVSRGPMERLSQATRETVHLGILDGDKIVYIGKQEGSRGLQMASYVGLLSPAQSTAMGKTLIADLPESAWTDFTEGIERRTKFTVTDPAEYVDELHTVRQQGFALDREENELGIRCVAAPIRDSSGKAVAAISLSGAAAYVTKQRQQELIPDVVACATEISRQLGFQDEGEARHA